MPMPWYGTALAQGYTATKAAPAASHRRVQGESSMAKPHDTQHQESFQEHPIVMELLAELQTIAEKERVECRFLRVMDWLSQNDM